MLIITEESHVDHALSGRVIEYLLKRYRGKEGFFIETFTLPKTYGTVPCGLYGPLMGDPPVPEHAVYYERRGGRPGESRMVAMPMRPTRTLTVIAGPDDAGNPCVLYTAFGGPLAPREPWDSSLNDEQRAESEAFWAEHALGE